MQGFLQVFLKINFLPSKTFFKNCFPFHFRPNRRQQNQAKMAPTPLLAKGNGTLARKWRKIKKRCSSFSSGDSLSRSKSEDGRYGQNQLQQQAAMADQDDLPAGQALEDEGIAIGEPNATLNTDASKFRHLRDKLQQWNSDLKKRRNSQV